MGVDESGPQDLLHSSYWLFKVQVAFRNDDSQSLEGPHTSNTTLGLRDANRWQGSPHSKCHRAFGSAGEVTRDSRHKYERAPGAVSAGLGGPETLESEIR